MSSGTLFVTAAFSAFGAKAHVHPKRGFTHAVNRGPGFCRAFFNWLQASFSCFLICRILPDYVCK